MARVVLAMSGGVDSSASAWLLQQQGHEVIGLFMRSGVSDEQSCELDAGPLPILPAKAHKQGCCSASDAADARRVADALDIPFHALNFRDAFGKIKDYFADEYLAGRTPNPCVMCNIWLKFGQLWEFARQIGADAIASGHYAQLSSGHAGAAPSLKRGVDRGKDQSYVLFGIPRDLLPHILFPVGTLQKSELRELARRAGIRTAEKPDSQEICFIPDNDYGRFLRDYRGETDTAGDFVDTAGAVLGQHRGYEHFTIGQRRGLGMAFGEPRFVVRIEPETRRVVLGAQAELGRTALTATRANWLIDPVPESFRATAQIRSQHVPGACTVSRETAEGFQVVFDEPQFGVAPGQAVVLYDDDRVLGGGWIE